MGHPDRRGHSGSRADRSEDNGGFMSMRDEFEKWAELHLGWQDVDLKRDNDDPDSYVMNVTQHAWLAWQAARAQGGQKVAIYYAVTYDRYIQYDTRNGQLEIYETREEAARNCPPSNVVVEIEVRKRARAQGGQEVEPVAFKVGDSLFWHRRAAEVVAQQRGAEFQALYTHPQPAQQGSVPEGWSLTHIDDSATDGYLIKGPGIAYCAWKDKEPWLYLFCEALATATPQPEGDGWIRCSERLPTVQDADEGGSIWISSPIGAVWLCSFHDAQKQGDGWHWKPTGLKRPQPPVEQEDKQ